MRRSAESVLNYISFVLLTVSIITSSFDIFLQIKINNFNIRISVVCMILMILIYIAKLLTMKSALIKVVAPISLLIWTFFIIIFIPNTHFLARNILYCVWLFIYLGFMLSMAQFTEKSLYLKLIRVYVYSNALISLVGIMQFLLYFLGVDFYLTQSFAENFPRINGFSYEPSYYATFLITGFIVNLYLLNHKSQYFNYYFLIINQILMFFAIFMSTSKLAIPIMLFSILAMSTYDILKKFSGSFSIYKKDLVALPMLMIALLVPIYLLVFDFDRVRFLFAGLGVAGTVSHSVTLREQDFDNTYQAFLNSPVIGYSLGGIPSAIGEVEGVLVTDNELAKDHEGMNVFMETLAGSGVIGFIFFAYFLIQLFRKPWKSAKVLENNDQAELAIVIKALCWGGLVLLLMLNFNQNILRPFLWVHFAFLNLSYWFAKNQIKEKLT